MAALSYLNFDLTVTPLPGGRYRAEANSPHGEEPTLDFDLPFSPEEVADLHNLLQQPGRDAERTQLNPRSAEQERRDRIKSFGERLYEMVFDGDVRAAFAKSLENANTQGAGVRLRLRLDAAPALAALPWEYLYVRSEQQFLALSERTPIVRYLRLATAITPLLVRPPINVLVMIADPHDYPRLDVEREWGLINDAMAASSGIAVYRAPASTRAALRAELRRRPYHVFHFIGHGDFEPATGAAVLLLEKDDRTGDLVGRDDLRVLLDHFHLRLAVLNSCEGAQTGRSDAFAGVAQGLVQQKIAAVIAMQFKISDDAAIEFARTFYGALADGLLVDAALTEARKAMYLARHPTEWGTPVLLMRSPDGRLFAIDRPLAEQQRQAQIEALARDARSALDAGDYALALDKLQQLVALRAQV